MTFMDRLLDTFLAVCFGRDAKGLVEAMPAMKDQGIHQVGGDKFRLLFNGMGNEVLLQVYPEGIDCWHSLAGTERLIAFLTKGGQEVPGWLINLTKMH